MNNCILFKTYRFSYNISIQYWSYYNVRYHQIISIMLFCGLQKWARENNEEICLSPMTKALTPTVPPKTLIANRLRAVDRSNNSNDNWCTWTGSRAPNLPTNRNSRVIRRPLKHSLYQNMSNGQSYNTKNRLKQFDYTAIANWLKMVSWSNYINQTGVVNWS